MKYTDRNLKIDLQLIGLLWTGMFITCGAGITFLFLTEYSIQRMIFGLIALVIFICLTFAFVTKLEFVNNLAAYLNAREEKE